MDRRSQLACLTTCRELLKKGVSVLFFPEGTRATDMRLQEFKKARIYHQPHARYSHSFFGVRCCLHSEQHSVDSLIMARLSTALMQGAFSVAAKAGVRVVPITLIGTGRKMPNKQESRLFPGDVEVVVHPPIGPGSADELLKASKDAIASSLPPEMLPLKA